MFTQPVRVEPRTVRQFPARAGMRYMDEPLNLCVARKLSTRTMRSMVWSGLRTTAELRNSPSM